MTNENTPLFKAAAHAVKLIETACSEYTVEQITHEDIAHNLYRVSSPQRSYTIDISPKDHDNYVGEAIREDDYPPNGFVKILDRRFELEDITEDVKTTSPPRDADTVLAEDIEAAVKTLNVKLRQAAQSGLKVEADIHEHANLRGCIPSVRVAIYREIKTTK